MILAGIFISGAKAEAKKPAAKAARKTTAQTEKKADSPDRLSQLLLSSPWCSFSYNKISGASHTSRVQFSQNGTWSSGSRGETYSSGQYGSVAGQHDGQAGGQWQVQDGQLLMSAPPQSYALTPVSLQVKQNSNGYPILVADGVEYSQCR